MVGAGGEIPFILPAPFLKDAEENSVGDVSVSLMPLENEKDMWRVVYTPSEEWLNSAQFPVTLDPAVVTVQNNASLIEDNYVTSKQPSTVQQVNLEVLRVTKGSGTWGTSNSFIKFNNGSLPTIDSSYYVTKAEFSIQTAQSGLYGLSSANNPTAASTVYLREVLGPWSSYTITYNNRPAVNNLILDYEYIPKNSELTWLNFDISNLVRKWYSNEGSNYGISLEAADNTWINFYSSDYAYAKPYVTVNYVSLAGLESSLAYEEQNVGRAGTGYVSLYNGNLIFEHPDTVCNGNLMPVSTTHYYNSCYHNQDVFGLGHGWKLNLQQCLHKETLLSNNSTVTYYVYTDGDGTRHHFKQSSGKWKDLSGLGMELTISGSSATITDKSNTAMLFDLPTVEFNGNYANVKMLQSITDSCGNVMTIHTGSNRQFIYATDGAGRYTESLRSVWMEELWGPEGAGTGVSFEYNNNGNLTKIYYQDGGSTTYTYNANGLLESVTNLDGYKVTYTYNGNGEPYRVNQVVFSNGNVLYSGRRYDYRDCLTVVTDLIPNAAGNALTEGRLLFYHFNDYGNVVSVNDQLGYACFAKYSDELPVNHPEVASKMQRSVVNLLKGHNMESTGSWTNMNISGTGTYSYATDAAYMGSKSLKMAKTNSTGLMTSYQIATLERGKTYTFSAYFKTLSSASAQLRAVYKDNVGIDVAKDSQKQKNNAAWDRISLTFTLPANSTSNSVTVYLMAADGAGSVWFDCAQLEGGAAANRYNMLLNGDFTFNTGAHPTAWLANSSNVSTTDIVTSTFSGTKPEGLSHNTMYLYGAGRSKYPGIYQDIPMSGNQGDVYTAGGWSFNYSKPRKGENFRYNIRVAFLKTGTSSTRENAPSIEWSEEWTDWQFAAGPVVAPCNYTSIRFNVDYERNVNHAEFGGLFLHKEEFGKTFAYDENGNVLSTKNLASMQSHATYDSEDNLLTYRQPGRPSTVKYTLDWGDTTAEKKKHLLKSTTSPLGIMTAATYDDKGNPLTSQTKNSSGSMVIESQTTYTANQNYVATQKDARGKVITNNTDLTKGTLTSVTDPKGQTVNYEYDDFKRTTGVYTTADGKTYRNAYTYTQDKLTKAAHNTTDDDVCDVEYNFEFDGAGRPTVVKVGSQPLSTTSYNPDGTVQKVTYGNSSAGSPQEVRYAYDDFKRLKGVQFDGETGDAYTYEYGANGQVMRLTDTILDRRMMSEYDTDNRPISRMKDWEFYDERLEKGVSGFKVSAEKRDAILEIRQMAEKKQFDILLVFMFDRLGRREDETPFLVEWFVQHGIEVWSTREGQQRIDNRGDKLMNYIRYWMAGGESEKTSMRVRAAHAQMTADGIWRGGKVPYGYRLVHNGRMGKKNRPLYDLEINPEQGIIVQDIFRLIGSEGCGSMRTANILNRKYPCSGKIWTAQTVREMVKNPIYTGRMHMNDIVSEPIENLRLVSDDDFAFVHYAMQSRIPRKEQLEKKPNGCYGESKWCASEHSAKLLSGLLYCGGCGGKLVGTYNHKACKDTVKYYPVYRCYKGSIQARRSENEQYSYSANKVEQAVLRVVRAYFDRFTADSETIWREQAKRQLRSRHENMLKELQAKVDKLQKQQSDLRREVVKSISGESVFDTALLQSLLEENTASLHESEKALALCQQEAEAENQKIKNMAQQFQNISAWAEQFDHADVETKKMILARIIERITIGKGYEIHIRFFLTKEDFMGSAEAENITISEASTTYIA